MATALTEYYPFSAGPGSAVTEAQWRAMSREWIESGVLSGNGNELAVVQDTPASMNVTVRSGQVRLEGHVGVQAADVDIAVGANVSGNPRIDLVVVRADYVLNVVEFAVKAGVPGAVPVAPVVTQDATKYELALATVAVANGAVSILTANITDARIFTYAEQDPPLPAYTTVQRDALLHVRNGLVIYNTTTGNVEARIAGAWVRVVIATGTTVRVAWTYTFPGDVKVTDANASAALNSIAWALIAVPAGQTVTLVGYRWFCGAGTSFTFSVEHVTGATFGTLATLVSGVVAAAASVKGSGSFTKACADGDGWRPKVTAISGTPNSGSVAVVADVVV